jgi:hypothetical protein
MSIARGIFDVQAGCIPLVDWLSLYFLSFFYTSGSGFDQI